MSNVIPLHPEPLHEACRLIRVQMEKETSPELKAQAEVALFLVEMLIEKRKQDGETDISPA